LFSSTCILGFFAFISNVDILYYHQHFRI
jgi:hypothetical protein